MEGPRPTYCTFSRISAVSLLGSTIGRPALLSTQLCSFEAAWLRLAQNVATATAGADSIAARIKNSTLTDTWKTAMYAPLYLVFA